MKAKLHGKHTNAVTIRDRFSAADEEFGSHEAIKSKGPNSKEALVAS